MNASGDEAQARKRNWPRPTSLPGPLAAALDVLKRQGCALGLLDLTRPDVFACIAEPLPDGAAETFAHLNERHRSIGTLPDTARRVLLQDAHIVSWPERRRAHASESEAQRAFHHWMNVLILCRDCHVLYDDTNLIPRRLILRARETALGTDTGRESLNLFLKRSLAYRDGRPLQFPDTDIAWAAFELKRLHGGDEVITVKPHCKDQRYFQSVIQPSEGMIRVGEYGGDVGEFHFGYAITNVPPPEPGVYSVGPESEWPAT